MDRVRSLESWCCGLVRVVLCHLDRKVCDSSFVDSVILRNSGLVSGLNLFLEIAIFVWDRLWTHVHVLRQSGRRYLLQVQVKNVLWRHHSCLIKDTVALKAAFFIESDVVWGSTQSLWRE